MLFFLFIHEKTSSHGSEDLFLTSQYLHAMYQCVFVTNLELELGSLHLPNREEAPAARAHMYGHGGSGCAFLAAQPVQMHGRVWR